MPCRRRRVSTTMRSTSKNTYARTQHTSTNQRRCVSFRFVCPCSVLYSFVLNAKFADFLYPEKNANHPHDGIQRTTERRYHFRIHTFLGSYTSICCCRGSHTTEHGGGKYIQSQSTVQISIHNTCRAYKRPSKRTNDWVCMRGAFVCKTQASTWRRNRFILFFSSV